MKLAEGLILRNDMMRKVASLKERISQNVIVQEGDTPDENPESLIKEALSVLRGLEKMICRINRTNMRCTLQNGRTMMEALARRDCLINQHAVLTGAIESAHEGRPDRYGRQEIKWVKVVEVAALQERVDTLTEQIRKLNAAIQEANWMTELEE